MQDSIKHEFNLYRCPKCMHIPMIKIFLERGNSFVDIQCCEFRNKIPIFTFISEFQTETNKCPHIKFKNNSYICIDCKKIFCLDCNHIHLNSYRLHTIYDSLFFDFKCITHDLSFIAFCKNCMCNLCNTCLTSHKNHQIKFFKDILISKEKMTQIKNDFFQAKKNMDILYNLKNDISKLSHDKIIIEQIEISSQSFQNKNSNISSILINFFSMYELYEKNPNYQIITNVIGNTNFNLEKADINLSSNKHSVELIGTYLKNLFFNSIIKNPILTYCCKNISNKEISKMKTVKLINAHSLGIAFLLILQDKRLASTSNDGFIIIYELTNLKPQIKIAAHSDWIVSLYQFKNGFLVSCSRDSSFKIWKIGNSSYTLLKQIQFHTSCVEAIIEISNNDYASCSLDKSIKVFNMTQNMDFICKKVLNFCTLLKQMIEIQDCLVAMVFDYSLHFFSINNDYKEVCVLNNIDCWSPNGIKKLNEEKFVIGGYKIIHIINGVSKQIEAQIMAHDDIIWCVSLLKDGTLLSGGNDKSIKQWDLNNYKCISEKKNAHNNSIITIVELSDGRIATASLEECDIKIWK